MILKGQYNLGENLSVYNPVAMANAALNNLVQDRITPHFNLVYNISSIFSATTDVVFDINNQRQARFLPQIATGRPFTETTVNRATTADFDAFDISTKTNFLYNPNWGDKHSFTGLLSFQTDDTRALTQGQITANSASSVLTDPSVPARTNVDPNSTLSSLAQTRTAAVLINGQYKYLDRYIINVALRGDGSSRFGPGQRYGLFPSVSARYRLSAEPFMKKFSNWLDEFSFRGGYGNSGNSPDKDYLFYSTYTNTASNYLGLSGLYPTSIQLTNLRWETLTGTDAGVNIILFKNRLNIDLDLYRNRTKNLLTPNLSIATFNGYSSTELNVGTLDNEGFELNILSTPYRSKNFNIDFNFNISNNINAVRSISPYYQTSAGNVTTNGSYLQVLQLNNPLGSFYGYKFKGVYKDADATIARDGNGNKIVSPNGTPVQMRFNYPNTNYLFQPGDAKYEDINHDGNINYQDVVYLGNGNPKFTGGFGPTFSYKGKINLQAFFNYRIGGQIINGTKMNTTNEYSFSNQSTAVLRRWRNLCDETDIPRALFNSGYNWLGSDRYVESGTFMRFRSITARYNFDKALASRISAKSLSVYVTGENLLILTKYTGQDPEVAETGSGLYKQVVDNSTTPPLKQITLGISASF